MNTRLIIEHGERLVDDLLIRDFGATGASFAARAEQAAQALPDDLAGDLLELARRHAALQSTPEPGPEAAGDFCFRCGGMHEKLRAFQHIQMEIESAIVGPDSIATMPLQASQSDRLAGFVEARDRVFRKVADFTLKFLLIGLGLLAMGLLIGVI